MPTKPRISYVAAKNPLELDNSSIVRKKVDKTTWVNWANKTELVNFIDSLYVPETSDTYMYIKCQCLREFIYTTKTSVPTNNITCSCGRKVIKYGLL